MGTEDWVLKGTKLITNIKKGKIKNLEQRLDSQQYNIKTTTATRTTGKKHTKSWKLYNIYMKFALNIQSFFFCKLIVGYKNEN